MKEVLKTFDLKVEKFLKRLSPLTQMLLVLILITFFLVTAAAYSKYGKGDSLTTPLFIFGSYNIIIMYLFFKLNKRA